MKVLIITNGAFPVPAVKGGACETLVENIVKENEAYAKIDIDLISIDDNKAEIESKKYHKTNFIFFKPNIAILGLDKIIHFFAFDILRKDNHLAYKTIFQRISFIYFCAKVLYKNNYDKVIFENQMALLWSLKYKDNLKKYENKFYFHLHNHPARYAKCEELVKKGYVIGVSNFINQKFKEKIREKSNERFYILQNCIDKILFDPSALTFNELESIKDKLKIKNYRIIVFAGRLIPGKGVKELITAFNNLCLNDVKLIIIGSFDFDNKSISSYEMELKKIINDNIIFTGFINYKEIPKYYALADIIVLPSICEEAAGLTIIEAASMKKPIITTDAGGIPEYIGSNAIIVSNDNYLVDNLEINMKKLLDDKKLCEELSAAALLCSEKYNLKNYYDNMLQIIKA